MAGAQDEAVAVRPVRVGRGVAEEPRPERVGHRRGAHRGAGMAGVRLLDAVDREGPDRVDRELVEGLRGGRHRRACSRWSGGAPDDPARSRHCRQDAGRDPRRPLGRISASRGAPTLSSGHAHEASPAGTPHRSTRTARRRPRRPRRSMPSSSRRGPSRPATDVPGRVALRQGGSAATTARWLARLGARTTLVCAVGRDHVRSGARRRGRGATGSASARPASPGSGPAGSGSSSRPAGSGASSRIARPRTGSPRRTWRRRRSGPTCSTCRPTRSSASRSGRRARRAIELARGAGALVSLDLASVGPLLARGRRAAERLVRDAAPDVLFATRAEAEALLGSAYLSALTGLRAARLIKQGEAGATVLARDGEARLDVRRGDARRSRRPTRPVPATPSTRASS